MARLLASIATLCVILPLIAAKSVTYEGLGTFNSEDFADGTHRIKSDAFCPQSPQHIDPEFSLYTRKNRDHPDILKFNSTESIKASNFDGSKPTKIAVHGFLDNKSFGTWMVDFRHKYLELEDVNVIIVEWHKGNGFPYMQACGNTRVVGAMLGVQIQRMVEAGPSSFDKFHILGHSLGSHVAGYAGKFIGSGKLGRITGLDPAGPMYEGIVPEGRLWHTDAKFVDSIHTDARPLIPNVGFGMYETCSHVDIYPNGGRQQPGCDEERITDFIFKGIISGVRSLLACNHQRAVTYYLESLDPQATPPKAYLCDTYENFLTGQCTDCGSNGEKCTMLGERDVQYSNSTDVNEGVDSTDGKRFFMVTGIHEPLISGYQYILHLHSTKGDKENKDKTAHIHLNFVTKSGHQELFKFADEKFFSKFFEPGRSLTHTGTMEEDPSEIEYIDFEWDHKGFDVDFLHLGRFHIDSIEVIALTSKDATTKSAPTVLKFCHDGDTKAKEHARFEKC